MPPVYEVLERNANDEVVNCRIIVAPTPSQAERFASRNRFSALSLTSMQLAEKVGQGYKVETATPVPPAEPAAPPAGAAAV